MRNVIRIAASAVALALPVMVAAQNQISGAAALSDCADLFASDVNDGELIIVKLTSDPSAPKTDFLFDLSNKGEGVVSGTNLDDFGWFADAVWRVPQAGSHMHFVTVTYDANRILLDSGTSVNFVFQAQAVQVLGASLPAGTDAGIGVTIPGNRSTYNVDLGATTGSFPRGTTSNGINIAFPALIDVSPFAIQPGCFVGGETPDPLDSATVNPTPTRGGIIGYNVYRIPDTGANTGSVAEFMTALNDGDDSTGWQYFIDLRTFRLTTADSTPGGFGTTSPIEVGAGTDLAGFQNPDARPYSGDEVLIFQDAAGNSGTPRATGTAPNTAQAYWYAVQPVQVGRVADFTADVGFGLNLAFMGNHRIDMDGDGQFDAISLDSTTAGGHNTPEFISPQAEVGLDGLGLTHEGQLFLTPPMHFNPAIALPATGQVALTASVSGADVNIQFTTGLEAGDVTGYNVYRVIGAERQRVNDQPILAQGNQSNVYRLVEQVADVRRLARGNSVQYAVEIVYADGSSREVGPFTVTLEQQAPGRRRR